MKRLFYMLYAAFFNICRIFPLKSNRVTFLSPHREKFTDSLGMVLKEVERKGEYDIVKISSSDLSLDKTVASLVRAVLFFTKKAYLLATSKYVFLNDNFMPMANLNFKSEAVVTQLWHAEGVFKKFGLDIPQPSDVRKREINGAKKLTWVVCSSKGVAPYYAKAFGVDVSKVLPLGSPRSDEFFKSRNIAEIRQRFDRRHPECKDKKLVLYAPTFRDNEQDDKALLQSFDFDSFENRLGSTHKLLLRLHPQIHRCDMTHNAATDVTDWDDVGELIEICDVMITDYSSVCMDAALIGKPIIFYAFDLSKYADERSFYFDYEAYVPGPVAKDFDSLLNLLCTEMSSESAQKLKKFREFNFDSPDGKATQRVVENIIK